MGKAVGSEERDKVLASLFEIERQLRLSSGYPYDSGKLIEHLEAASKGRFTPNISKAERKKQKNSSGYFIEVDYRIRIEDQAAQLLKNERYHSIDPNVNRNNFPFQCIGWFYEEIVPYQVKKDIFTENAYKELISDDFDPSYPSGVVENELEEKGMRPADIWELIAFGIKYPKIQQEFAIIALGSTLYGDAHKAPILYKGALGFINMYGYFPPYSRFAAVPKNVIRAA